MVRCWISCMVVDFLLTSVSATLISVPIDLEKHLQPLDVGINHTYDQLPDDPFLCSRNCTKYPEARICYYKLVAEQYHAMGPACKNCPDSRADCYGPQCITADGIERTVLAFNRMIPGPAFHICFGDRVIVDVDNKMPAREIAIHWHGQLQKTSPWEDGVPFVTQCPIAANTKFRYDFRADTSGTHFYHSHSPLQLFDGLSGQFVVRTSAKTDPVSGLYDYDLFSHTIQIRDWLHELIDVRYPGYYKNRTYLGQGPYSYLINGRGNYMDIASEQRTNTPLAEFVVKKGFKYRFRIIIDTSTTCSLQFAIQDHPMMLIAADGYPVKPQIVRSLFLTAADIYDVVIDANKPVQAYWIRIQGYNNQCSPAVQQAILRYEGSDSQYPSVESNTPALFDAIRGLPVCIFGCSELALEIVHDIGSTNQFLRQEFNNIQKSCLGKDNFCLDKVKSTNKAPNRILGVPDQRLVFEASAYNFKQDFFDYGLYKRFYMPSPVPGTAAHGGMAQDTMNNISNLLPPFALLQDPKNPLINQMKCPDECSVHCDCLHLIKLGYNTVIEMIFVDLLSIPTLQENHPFHIHGHHWYIMKYGSKAEYSDDPNRFKIDPTNEYPVIRDTVPVPGEGYAVVRFIADNPGFWLLHCHFTSHNDNGMQLVLQVGEPKDFIQSPETWPKCGDYLPTVW